MGDTPSAENARHLPQIRADDSSHAVIKAETPAVADGSKPLKAPNYGLRKGLFLTALYAAVGTATGLYTTVINPPKTGLKEVKVDRQKLAPVTEEDLKKHPALAKMKAGVEKYAKANQPSPGGNGDGKIPEGSFLQEFKAAETPLQKGIGDGLLGMGALALFSLAMARSRFTRHFTPGNVIYSMGDKEAGVNREIMEKAMAPFTPGERLLAKFNLGSKKHEIGAATEKARFDQVPPRIFMGKFRDGFTPRTTTELVEGPIFDKDGVFKGMGEMLGEVPKPGETVGEILMAKAMKKAGGPSGPH